MSIRKNEAIKTGNTFEKKEKRDVIQTLQHENAQNMSMPSLPSKYDSSAPPLGNVFSSKMGVLRYLENCDLTRANVSCKVCLKKPI